MRDVGRNHAGEASDNYAEREGWRLRSMSPKLDLRPHQVEVKGKAPQVRDLAAEAQAEMARLQFE